MDIYMYQNIRSGACHGQKSPLTASSWIRGQNIGTYMYEFPPILNENRSLSLRLNANTAHLYFYCPNFN